MESVVLKILLMKLDVLISDEIRLLSGVGEGISNIKNHLGRMLEVLRNANGSEYEKKRWVKELREVAFRTQDVTEEFQLTMVYIGGRGLSDFPRHAAFEIKNAVARRKFAKEIKSIQSEIKKIHERNKVYPTDLPSAPAVQQTYNHQEDAHNIREVNLGDIREPSQYLKKFICRDRSDTTPIILSVVGMGGTGKSTLVREVYDDLRVQDQFKKHAWITVCQRSDASHLLKDLISQLCKDNIPLERTNVLELKGEVTDLLKDGYLIVLDDVWSIDSLEGIRSAFPNNKRGRLVITTSNTQVANMASRFNDRVYHMQPLSYDDSWALFCARSFRDGCCPSELEETCKIIVRKLGGMPLAIRMIAAILFTKQPPTLDDCNKIILDLGADVDGNHPLKSIYTPLSICYDALPDHLLICLLYLSMFPEGYLIECPRLIRLWISEGLVDRVGQNTLEQSAENYLNELINRNLIQVAERAGDGRVRTCRMHNLLRDIILTKSKDQYFAGVVKSDDKQMPDNPRRLALHNSSISIEKIQSPYLLRSFLLFEVRESVPTSTLPDLSGKFFRLLTVLDLQGSSLKEFPESIVTLVNLKFLSLRHTKVTMVPSTISKLRKLETLDLKHTQVSELPAQIIKLTQLRCLLLYHYKLKPTALAHSKHGFQAPDGIKDLKTLQKLCFVKAGIVDKVVVDQLGELPALTRLGVIELSTDNDKALCKSISKLTKLQALSITLSSLSSDKRPKLKKLEEGSNLPASLRRLHLTGKLKKLPDWVGSLINLVKIFLKSSELGESPLEVFEGFPNLLHMELIKAFTGDALIFKKGKFENLKVLGLREFNNLKTVTLETNTMPNLERFTIERCERMKAVPEGIEYLTNLKVLNFVNMPRELFMTMHPQRAEAADYRKIRHIPVVNFSYDVDDHHWTETLSANTS
ncbi:hypothetical protein QQ045_021132 [Rhodiola kirilowii]